MPFLPGNASLEAAIDWIIDHNDDPDIDEMPLVWFGILACAALLSDIAYDFSVLQTYNFLFV